MRGSRVGVGNAGNKIWCAERNFQSRTHATVAIIVTLIFGKWPSIIFDSRGNEDEGGDDRESFDHEEMHDEDMLKRGRMLKTREDVGAGDGED